MHTGTRGNPATSCIHDGEDRRNTATRDLVLYGRGQRLWRKHMANPQSTASIAGHPIHPMLVPFPIAFFVGTFVTDLVIWRTGVAFWSAASFWLLSAGLVMAALAAVIGLIDVLGEPRIQKLQDAWWHAGGNVLAVLIALYNWYGRYA